MINALTCTQTLSSVLFCASHKSLTRQQAAQKCQTTAHFSPMVGLAILHNGPRRCVGWCCVDRRTRCAHASHGSFTGWTLANFARQSWRIYSTPSTIQSSVASLSTFFGRGWFVCGPSPANGDCSLYGMCARALCLQSETRNRGRYVVLAADAHGAVSTAGARRAQQLVRVVTEMEGVRQAVAEINLQVASMNKSPSCTPLPPNSWLRH